LGRSPCRALGIGAFEHPRAGHVAMLDVASLQLSACVPKAIRGPIQPARFATVWAQ
jgi:hypothetical protein